jgi:O-antigen ligase
MLAFMMVAVHRFVQKPELRFSAVRLLVWIAALCGTLALLEAVQIIPGKFPRWGTNFNRAALGFGQPNALGLFFVLTLPFAAGLLRSARSNAQRWSAVGALCAIVGGLAATFSRGSWLSLLGGTLILWFAGERRYLAKIWLTGIALVLAIELVSGGAISDTARRTLTDWVLEQRAGLMIAGLLMFWEHPLVGVGPGGFAPNLVNVATEVPQLYDYLPTPHNAFIQMAAESGIFGLLLFILLLIVAVRCFIKRAREPGIDAAEKNLRLAVLWSFAGLVVTCLVVWPFSHGSGQVVMLVAAIGWAVPTGRTLT